MSRYRVLFITGEYPPLSGGIADYTHQLICALDRTFVEPIVLSRRDTSADEVVYGWSWHTSREVRELVRRLDIDLVHIQYQAGAFDMHPALNMLPALLGGTPVVTTFHDLRPPYLFPKAGRMRFFAIKRMARSSDMAIVTNPRDEFILSQPGIPMTRIPLGPSLPVPDGDVAPDRTIGYFGFPSRQKGFDLLVEAIGRIPGDARPALTIVGGNPPETGRHGFMSAEIVSTLAKRHSVDVTRTGFVPAQGASNALARCAVLAFPFPAGATLRSSALIAALQTGRPVVTTTPVEPSDLEGLAHLPQLIQVARKDVDALHHALESALSTPSTWQPLPKEYAWESIAARHLNLYQTLLREVRH